MKKPQEVKTVLNVHFQSLGDFKKGIEQALAKRTKLIQPKSEIYFESVVGFRKFMTFQKIELISAIACCNPSSIYELAKTLDRDFAAVLRDCVALSSVGFISLEEGKDARGSKIPKLPFPYSVIRVYFPNNSRQMELKLAA